MADKTWINVHRRSLGSPYQGPPRQGQTGCEGYHTGLLCSPLLPTIDEKRSELPGTPVRDLRSRVRQAPSKETVTCLLHLPAVPSYCTSLLLYLPLLLYLTVPTLLLYLPYCCTFLLHLPALPTLLLYLPTAPSYCASLPLYPPYLYLQATRKGYDSSTFFLRRHHE